jgi:hypothetical protein
MLNFLFSSEIGEHFERQIRQIDGEMKSPMKRRTISLHYCNRCRMTTRHTESLESATCSRCGVEKPSGREPRTGHKHLRHEDAAAEAEVDIPLHETETGWN